MELARSCCINMAAVGCCSRVIVEAMLGEKKGTDGRRPPASNYNVNQSLVAGLEVSLELNWETGIHIDSSERQT